jgi:transcriptional regulator with XRE-family HTH domain
VARAPPGGTDLAEEVPAMSERDAFGPNLRRIRVQRGISIYEIVTATNVSAALWEGLEANDLKRWPTGIYARAYVRSYAKAIGVDPETTVDDFCRWFPQGDRRAEIVIRGHAEIIGHLDLQYQDQAPPGDGDRRGAAAAPRPPRKAHATPASAFGQLFDRLRALLRA